MKIKAQMAMVLNLDKCIGCHTCSIPCKHVWTNRSGMEYVWFNDVETKPGIGYPQNWEDQNIHKGGWTVKDGKLHLRAGNKLSKLMKIFHNPNLPTIDDYYDPWNYNYSKLITAPEGHHQPCATAESVITGQRTEVKWGPNWEDDLAGVNKTGLGDINFQGSDPSEYLRFRDVFMFYLPRLCEHCLNPACVASCPSGALYKRDEDGIVLVDQERCRGWRYCVSGCPYKKVYFNWNEGRSEKCIFCYPRIESGMTTLCSDSCVGRIRYVGTMLYDAEAVQFAAAVTDPKLIYQSHVHLFLDPHDPQIEKAAKSDGVPESYIAAAKRSPVYKLIVKWKLALPLHPEFRTLPMVWYIPPLSPVKEGFQIEDINTDLNSLRIPLQYLANLLTAGYEEPVERALQRLLAIRSYKRSQEVYKKSELKYLEPLGLTESEAEDAYRLLAIAKYKDRFVVPTSKKELTEDMAVMVGETGFPE